MIWHNCSGHSAVAALPLAQALRTMDGKTRSHPLAGLSHLPRQLTALCLLQDLDVSGQELDGEGALDALLHLTLLTALCISECSLLRLPPQLAALSRLRSLDMAQNSESDAGTNVSRGGAVWERVGGAV